MKAKLLALLLALLSVATFAQQPNSSGKGNDNRTPLMVLAFAEPETIKLGESVTLTANASGGTGVYSYLWSPKETIASPHDPVTIATPNEIGIMVYTIIVNDGINTAEADVFITVNEPQTVFCPTPNDFSGISYENGIDFGARLSWDIAEYEYTLDRFEIYRSEDGYDFAMVQHVMNIPAIEHYQCNDRVEHWGLYYYRIIAFYQNDCQSDFLQIQVEVTPTASVSESNDETFALYPNPTHGKVTIETDGPQTISILNSIGQTLCHIDTKANTNSIDLSSFGKGLYLLMVQTEKSIKMQKIIVE